MDLKWSQATLKWYCPSIKRYQITKNQKLSWIHRNNFKIVVILFIQFCCCFKLHTNEPFKCSYIKRMCKPLQSIGWVEIFRILVDGLVNFIIHWIFEFLQNKKWIETKFCNILFSLLKSNSRNKYTIDFDKSHVHIHLLDVEIVRNYIGISIYNPIFINNCMNCTKSKLLWHWKWSLCIDAFKCWF